MSTPSTRDFLAYAAVVLAVCVGAWFMLVKPKAEELARLEQDLQEQKAAASSGFNQQAIEKAADRMTSIKARLAEIESFNALAGDSSRLYGLVMDLADANQVQVHNLQPGGLSASAPKPTTASPEECQVNVSRLNMSIEGSYENIAAFFDAACSLKAFIRPLNVQLMPSRVAGRNTVEASFACDILSFTMAGSLANLAGTTDEGIREHAQP